LLNGELGVLLNVDDNITLVESIVKALTTNTSAIEAEMKMELMMKHFGFQHFIQRLQSVY